MNVIWVALLFNLVPFLLIEGVPQALDIWLETRVSVDTVHHAVLFNEIRTNLQDLRHLKLERFLKESPIHNQ